MAKQAEAEVWAPPPPRPLAREEWPPVYRDVYRWRYLRLTEFEANPKLVGMAKAYYARHPVEFICHWCDTYDPRNAGRGGLAYMPFILFERQAELIEFLLACLEAEENGLVEKARDMGATWLSVALSVWLWLFRPGASVGWGSRKEQLVDKIGDPDSIFEKIRLLVKRLPPEFMPRGFSERDHMTYMKLINPENDSTITGEVGDNIGRGGRKLIYFKDESAHYARPELIEAALGDNTRVQIDISSVNGLGNIFHRRREAGVEWHGGPAIKGSVNVFIMDWRDHPAKDQDWYDARRKRAEAEGLLHLFAQEVDRDYGASVEGVIIKPEWVAAAIDADKKLGLEATGPNIGALDVGDEGLDKNALAIRRGPCLLEGSAWPKGDTGQTTRRAVADCSEYQAVTLMYDSIGVGAGVKAEVNRLTADNKMPKNIKFVPWNAGAGPLFPEARLIPGDPQSPRNKDYFANLKAQGWFHLAQRFERTYRAVTEGIKYDPDDLISLPSTLRNLNQIRKELSQPTRGLTTAMKMMVNKTPEGTHSPNLGDAIMMAYWPIQIVAPMIAPKNRNW